MTRASVLEYTEAVRERYLKSGRKEKGRILDEFTKVMPPLVNPETGRVHGVSPHRGSPSSPLPTRLGRPPSRLRRWALPFGSSMRRMARPSSARMASPSCA